MAELKQMTAIQMLEEQKDGLDTLIKYINEGANWVMVSDDTFDLLSHVIARLQSYSLSTLATTRILKKGE